jgi:hypothetical protein
MSHRFPPLCERGPVLILKCHRRTALSVINYGSVVFLVKVARNEPRHPDEGPFEAR